MLTLFTRRNSANDYATPPTCVGYGNIAPKTALGRFITIPYAIVGIPLTLLTIAHLGAFMATVFRFLYKNVICGVCLAPCRRRRRDGHADDELDDDDDDCDTTLAW